MAAPPARPGELSEQVLRQKAQIAQLSLGKGDYEDEDGEETGEGEDGEEEGDDEQDDVQRRLRRLMAKVKPCHPAFHSSLAQSTERQRIECSGTRWSPVKGLHLLMKSDAEDDCVLLVANALHTPESDLESSRWAMQRAGSLVSPKFAVHTRQRGCSHALCMPYLDQPGKRMELEYQVAANAAGSTARLPVSEARQRRQLLAVALPAHQCAWLEDDEKQVIEPGPWRDVDNFYEVVTTLPGDRVLVLCTAQYAAGWASELNRGRFTILRDEVGLDGPHDRGLQSVRALGPALQRTLVMATVDDPPPGPHIYRVRAAVTAGTDSGVANALQGDRQLALIRLPGSLVVGPNHSDGPVHVDSLSWTEIPGLEVTISTKRPRDKVLLVFHTDCNPQAYSYQAHFTLLRRSATGPACNLGYSEDFGLEMVSSEYPASSEFPVGLLCDVPGTPGPHTYRVAARVANTGTSSDAPAVVVGYSGSLSAVILPAR